MSSDYNKFFKAAKNSKAKPVKPMKKKTAAEEYTAEQYIRQALNLDKSKPKSKLRSMPIFSVLTLAALVGGGLYFIFNQAAVTDFYSRIDFGFLSSGLAAEPISKQEKSTETKSEKPAEAAGEDAKVKAAACTEVKGFSEEELSHFNKLNERKKELDQREGELSLLEEELHKQKSEIEQRISKLEQIREEVATVLKDRVEIDQQRVNTLVDFYSNMKPKQAAEVFSKLNEDLAVEVLGKLKKKNAADILNLIEPGKARSLSEKFTGYTRR